MIDILELIGIQRCKSRWIFSYSLIVEIGSLFCLQILNLHKANNLILFCPIVLSSWPRVPTIGHNLQNKQIWFFCWICKHSNSEHIDLDRFDHLFHILDQEVERFVDNCNPFDNFFQVHPRILDQIGLKNAHIQEEDCMLEKSESVRNLDKWSTTISFCICHEIWSLWEQINVTKWQSFKVHVLNKFENIILQIFWRTLLTLSRMFEAWHFREHRFGFVFWSEAHIGQDWPTFEHWHIDDGEIDQFVHNVVNTKNQYRWQLYRGLASLWA